MLVVDSDTGVEGDTKSRCWVARKPQEGRKTSPGTVEFGLGHVSISNGALQNPEPWLVSSAAPSSPGTELRLQLELLLSTDSGGFSSPSSFIELGIIYVLTPAGKHRAGPEAKSEP